MRIRRIALSWFRGAGASDSLELGSRSTVVYGANGSGKSSFVDAIEYALREGKIRHLAHEYSGRRQEKGIRNTHTPEGENASLAIHFGDGSEVNITTRQDGSRTRTGSGVDILDAWDYQRTILRQDEVAKFIHGTKADKYSSLLPLLGLGQLEIAAHNVRQLARAIKDHVKLDESKAQMAQVNRKRDEALGRVSDAEVLAITQELHREYCPEKVATGDSKEMCREVEAALTRLIAGSSTEQKKWFALQEVAELELKEGIAAVRTTSAVLAEEAEPLIQEKLDILSTTDIYVNQLQAEVEVECPSCGRLISVEDFREHVRAERERLGELLSASEERKAAIKSLVKTFDSLKSRLSKPALQEWRQSLAEGPLAGDLAYLDASTAEGIWESCTEEALKELECRLLPIIDAAASSSNEPPDAKRLFEDKQTIEVVSAVFTSAGQACEVDRAEALLSFLERLEQGIREEIRLQTEKTMKAISDDIQAMWSILHPDAGIDRVRLYIPRNMDKAIDVGVEFHGVEQESPRLTLSEGYRNGLGLCIFLALVKHEADADRPLLLDDVVVSLDRNHRGMIAELLKQEFGSWQVVILTHDREWYTELRHQLDSKHWSFKALLPYESPALGIRWSDKAMTFEDARAHLKKRPDAAGNDARKIMDVELASVAERLRIRMPYLRGHKNDIRTSHDFIERLIAESRKRFGKSSRDGYIDHTDATEAFRQADQLLVSWANRGSHSFDLVAPEARQLIDACENALKHFECSGCGKAVWYADAGTQKKMQCQCGAIQWRYG